MPDNAYIKGKTKAQLLADLYGTAHPGSPVHEQLKMAILSMNTEEIAAALDRLAAATRDSAMSSAVVGRRLVILNFLLAAATVVGAVATFFLAVQAIQ